MGGDAGGSRALLGAALLPLPWAPSLGAAAAGGGPESFVPPPVPSTDPLWRLGHAAWATLEGWLGPEPLRLLAEGLAAVLWLVSSAISAGLAVLSTVAGDILSACGLGASGDWAPPEPVFLPAELEVLAVPEHYRLQRADGDLATNTSLRARTETFLLLPHGSGAQPLLRASYTPFSTRQEVPTRSPPEKEGWAVRAVSLESAVSLDEPVARVLFHLRGPDWLPGQREPPGERDLPCVTLHAHHRGRVARGTCRLQAPLGVCVVELEIPPRWFSPAAPAPRAPLEPAELHYGVLGPGACGRAGGRGGSDAGPREAPRYLGPLELRVAAPARRQEVRLDERVLLRVPDATLRPGQRFAATLALRHNFTAQQLTLRASEAVEFLHLDLAVENGTGGLAPARPLTWQVEYPGQDPEAQKDKLVWEVQVSERDVRALVPLVQELELLNTAPLTGVPRAVPVTLVTVEAGGGVAEVTEPLGCESADKQVLQVADSCDAVFVGGKESRGARGARVDFWSRRLHASLLFTVWAPLLPLRIQLGDTTLEQLRGWRLPGATESADGEADEPGEEAERRARGCRPQYQRTSVRFLAHFVAHPRDGGRHLSYLPGPEWLLDVTHLVAGRARVQDPRVATMEGDTVVVGREPGVTSVEVRSPVSDSILGEQTLVVSEEKVTVTELRAQLVAGLALALRTEPGHPGVVTATCQATGSLRTPKQEATLSVWLSFSDGTLAPLELYGWQDVALAVTSQDPAVVTVAGGLPGAPSWRPRVLAEGPGRGTLLQLSLHPPDACRRGRHRAAALATGSAWLEVGAARRGTPPGSPRPPAPFPRAEGAMSGEAVTAGGEPRRRNPGGVGLASTKLQGLGSSSEEEEEQGEEGRGRAGREEEEEEEEEEMVKAPARVTDLEIGMYVLLGVFCLAIFIFLVNCIFFVLRYQQKEPPDAGAAPSAPQPHNWVWLGTDQEELSRQLDRQQPEPPAPTPPQPGTEAGRCCCGDPQVPAAGSPPTAPPPAGTPPARKEGAAPGGGRRKRVEFVTFAPPRVPEEPPQPAPNVQSILVASEDDIRWVCEDMGLRDPEELRSYMERIRGSS
ncbi:transmembrane protein 132A isoform X2 [Anas acuta]|uniref:transmembrane protein 132A isoform X2 n=1 Tax=Anas acuta TaxID=28680 RepID=UPI0035C8E9F4